MSSWLLALFAVVRCARRAGPSDAATFFVHQHYRDFLKRDPDAAGLQFWTSGIIACGADSQSLEVKRVNTSAAFFLCLHVPRGCPNVAAPGVSPAA